MYRRLRRLRRSFALRKQLHCLPEHGQAQNGRICILSILSTSVGQPIAKNKSGPHVAAI